LKEHTASIFRIGEQAKQASTEATGSRQSSLLHTGFLFGSHFDPEDGDNIFLRNIGSLLPDYMVICAKDITVSELLQLQVITSYKYFVPQNISCIDEQNVYPFLCPSPNQI
jgi:hypothetical protein